MPHCFFLSVLLCFTACGLVILLCDYHHYQNVFVIMLIKKYLPFTVEMAVPELTNTNSEPEKIEGRACLTWHGSRHDNGESWNDGCRVCYCHNGVEMCSLISCPVPLCSNPVFRIGDCCPTCPGEILSDEVII